MPKILLAIFTCHKYEYTICDFKDWFTRPIVDRVSGIRDSWLKDVTGDYKFFYGRGPRQPLADEVFLNCPDDYHHSYEKIRALIKYTLDNGYDRLCKIDDDVWVYYDRLMANVPTANYVGSGRGFAVTDNFAPFHTTFCPGFTYWLSKESMEILLSSPAGEWAEDRWVGEALKRRRVHLTTDNHYHLVKPTRTNQYISDEELEKPNDYLTIHSRSPEQMRRHHKSLGER